MDLSLRKWENKVKKGKLNSTVSPTVIYYGVFRFFEEKVQRRILPNKFLVWAPCLHLLSCLIPLSPIVDLRILLFSFFLCTRVSWRRKETPLWMDDFCLSFGDVLRLLRSEFTGKFFGERSQETCLVHFLFHLFLLDGY